jgi:hypothetical protein
MSGRERSHEKAFPLLYMVETLYRACSAIPEAFGSSASPRARVPPATGRGVGLSPPHGGGRTGWRARPVAP